MIGTLSEFQLQEMLYSEVTGRIGLVHEGKVHVVPVNYGYDGKSLYVHSGEGLKIQAMRKNPQICFEIDNLQKSGSWQSVILWGKFEELKTVREQNAGMKIFTQQMARLIPSKKAMPSHGNPSGPGKKNDPFKSVVFRILIEEWSGKFEKK